MDDQPSTSMSGTSQQTTEPTDTASLPPKSDNSTSNPPSSRDLTAATTSSSKRLLPKRAASSAASSPLPSRESSPVRPPLKTTSRSAGTSRSRKNSVNDVSPSRPATNPPSAAAQQRALSVASIPSLKPTTSELSGKSFAGPQKLPATAELKETPRWPTSPRLRSPPPMNKLPIASPRKPDQDLPAINVQQSASQTAEQTPEVTQTKNEANVEDSLSISGTKGPARGASGSSILETVQEVSQPNTPGNGLDGVSEKADYGFTQQQTDNALEKGLKTKGNNESGSESGGKSEIKMKATTAPPVVRAAGPATKYSSNTSAGRGKPSGEGSAQNMTIETETVSSIPQVAMVGPAGGINGSIRTKPSSETIRPKKKEKKSTRKSASVASGTGEQLLMLRSKLHHHHQDTREDISDAPVLLSHESRYSQGLYMPMDSSSLTSADRERPMSQMSQTNRHTSLTLQNIGTTMLTKSRPASSKADIFEAKVASAVDEANSSDSEETFVYESNPPDVQDRPRRYHSRTPSATSMMSQVDPRSGIRSMADGGHHSVAMKKSMKFANSYNNSPDVATGEDDGRGTTRSNVGTGRGTTHHHHIGRWGRNGGNGHSSIFDNESPFPSAAKSKLAGNTSRQSSRPESPRGSNATRLVPSGKKSAISQYDIESADNEQTPLLGSIRSGRSGRTRRPATGSMRHLGYHNSSRRASKSYLHRYAGCLVLTVVLLLVCLGAVAFALATTQPLGEVKVIALKNVLASEQDIIFDMKVEARNPNLIGVTIDQTDLVIFAKSKYAGTDSQWWNRPQTRSILRWVTRRSESNPDDDDDDDNGDPPTFPNLEIGRVFELDSPLIFDGSPFHHPRATSTGQIRIVHPGNHTTPAGSERWGKVLQHEFELIIRGTLKYTLPFNQKFRNISVEGRVSVKPNAADTDPDAVADIDPDNVHII